MFIVFVVLVKLMVFTVLSCSSIPQYEPELFPGLIYRMSDPKVCLLIFVSGKVVLTGAKSKTDIDNAYRKIYPELVKYKKQPRQD